MKCSRLLIASVLLLGSAEIHAQSTWVASWASPQQLVEPHNSLAPEDLRDTTLRQIVHLSLGGSRIRVHLSNRFGTAPLHFTSVHIAKAVSPASPKIAGGSDRALTFSGKPDVIIPAGADYISDPLDFPVEPFADLAISLRIESPPEAQTGNPGSRSDSYVASGNLVSAGDMPGAKQIEHWYFIAGIDVLATAPAGVVVALGDSITGGHGVVTNSNGRWTDLLAKRLQASSIPIAVVNQGIGGNRVLLDGLGPNALARFDHDVLALAGARYLIVSEGINDIGMLAREHDVPQADHDSLVHRTIAAYEQMITRAHAHRIQVIGTPLMPFVGSNFYHPGPATEADRQAINQWIRAPGHFDAVVDFDKVTRDPEHPDRLLPQFDSGDHLHPSPAGFAAMADAVPLALFTSHSAPLQIALTFDDLPEHGSLPPGETRLEVIQKIVATLRQANAPAYGFVNGSWLQQRPEDEAALAAWHQAGYALGNHGWSHMNLNQHTLEEFEADLARNEPLLSNWKDNDWHWLRFPFLAEGDTPQKQAGIRTYLLQRGYKVAGVTMSFADYMWTEAYARCRSKGDQQAIALLESSFLKSAEENIEHYRSMAQTLLGRDIPYVLLMHVGALDAKLLPKILELYRSKGFQFISLEEAERDPFYLEDTDLKRPPAPDSLEGALMERHLTVPPSPTLAVPFDQICR